MQEGEFPAPWISPSVGNLFDSHAERGSSSTERFPVFAGFFFAKPDRSLPFPGETGFTEWGKKRLR